MNDPLWYMDAVIYEAHVKSFSDSNNDGIGDFNGLTQKLDYLQDLGVTCLWLLPFFPSPLKEPAGLSAGPARRRPQAHPARLIVF